MLKNMPDNVFTVLRVPTGCTVCTLSVVLLLASLDVSLFLFDFDFPCDQEYYGVMPDVTTLGKVRPCSRSKKP